MLLSIDWISDNFVCCKRKCQTEYIVNLLPLIYITVETKSKLNFRLVTITFFMIVLCVQVEAAREMMQSQRAERLKAIQLEIGGDEVTHN